MKKMRLEDSTQKQFTKKKLLMRSAEAIIRTEATIRMKFRKEFIIRCISNQTLRHMTTKSIEMQLNMQKIKSKKNY